MVGIIYGAGANVNYKYGFGAVDARSAVNTATTWQSVGEEIALSSEQITIDSTIPDNNTTGISSSFEITENIKIESVEVIFDAEHSNRGDLELVLTSPDGTESILAEPREDDGDNYDNWLFTSVRHWGESSQGEWTLTVTDETVENEGTWNSWQINVYGARNSESEEDTEDTENSTDPDNSDNDNGDEQANPINPDDNSNDNSEAVLNTPLYRFQNETVPGTYIYVGEAEAENIRENFVNFTEEGFAFNVGIEPGDDLIPIYRFQSEINPSTYLFVGEAERNSINNDFADSFTEEGLAFYVYSADSSLGEPIYRFQNQNQLGTYLFAATSEADSIRENVSNFEEEGIAFAVNI